MIKDIKTKQKELERKEFEIQPAIDQAAKTGYEIDPIRAREYLTDYCIHNANAVVAEWWDFADYLITKYNDGYMNIPKISKGVGYPAWWLKDVGYDKGPTQYKQPDNRQKE
jgi:dipeptidase